MTGSNPGTLPPAAKLAEQTHPAGEKAPSAWRSRGIDDVYYQREAQVNWWSVLGGVAVAALLTQLPDLLSQVVQGRWSLVLYFTSTALIIVLSWVQTAWGTLVLRWRISIGTALLGFFSGLSLSIMGLQVTMPAAWMFAASLVALSSIASQLYFQRSGAWNDFAAPAIKRLKAVIWAHAVFGVVALGAGILLLIFPGRVHETIWAIASLSMAIVSIWLQSEGMKRERSEFGIA